jgi:hypothetical protein
MKALRVPDELQLLHLPSLRTLWAYYKAAPPHGGTLTERRPTGRSR